MFWVIQKHVTVYRQAKATDLTYVLKSQIPLLVTLTQLLPDAYQAIITLTATHTGLLC